MAAMLTRRTLQFAVKKACIAPVTPLAARVRYLTLNSLQDQNQSSRVGSIKPAPEIESIQSRSPVDVALEAAGPDLLPSYSSAPLNTHTSSTSSLEMPQSSTVNSLLYDPTAPMSLGDLHQQGLASYFTPVGWVQSMLEFMHVSLGMQWGIAIISTTVAIRILLLKPFVTALSNNARMQLIKPETKAIKDRSDAEMAKGDKYAGQKAALAMKDLYKRNNVSMAKSLMLPVFQIPIFMSFYWALNSMCGLPVSQLTVGGLAWFTDLTAPDPLKILPVLSAALSYIGLELGQDGVNGLRSQVKNMKIFMRVMPLIICAVTWNFYSAVLLYWTTSNVMTVLISLLMRVPRIRRACNLPSIKDAIKARELTKGEEIFKGGFIKNFKETLKANTDANALNIAQKALPSAEKVDLQSFERGKWSKYRGSLYSEPKLKSLTTEKVLATHSNKELKPFNQPQAQAIPRKVS